MGATKHEKTFVDYDKSYEKNIIGLRGVFYFAIGLVILIIITFSLMFLLQNVMENAAQEWDAKDANPMKQNLPPSAQLPPEPRLQGAPGFGVDSPDGRINLELTAPQSEYYTLHKEWEKEWADGQKDPKTGTIITLPIEEAKQKLLQENPKANPNGQKAFDQSRDYYSYSSAGRLESGKRK